MNKSHNSVGEPGFANFSCATLYIQQSQLDRQSRHLWVLPTLFEKSLTKRVFVGGGSWCCFFSLLSTGRVDICGCFPFRELPYETCVRGRGVVIFFSHFFLLYLSDNWYAGVPSSYELYFFYVFVPGRIWSRKLPHPQHPVILTIWIATYCHRDIFILTYLSCDAVLIYLPTVTAGYDRNHRVTPMII